MVKVTKKSILYFLLTTSIGAFLIIPAIRAVAIITSDDDTDYIVSERSISTPSNKYSTNYRKDVALVGQLGEEVWIISLILVAIVLLFKKEVPDIYNFSNSHIRAPPSN